MCDDDDDVRSRGGGKEEEEARRRSTCLGSRYCSSIGMGSGRFDDMRTSAGIRDAPSAPMDEKGEG